MADYSKIKGRKGKHSLRQKLSGSTFTPLRHDLINSDEFAALSLAAKAMFFHLLGKYKGYNNGDLEMPQTKEQAERLNISPTTLKKGLRELIERNFVELTRQGGKNQCSLYALTCFEINEINKQGIVLRTSKVSDKWRKPKPPD